MHVARQWTWIEATPQNLVLENLSFPFKKPNILDIKLGTILYDESASPEKVERMIKTAKETTSLETGVRLTGFQVGGLLPQSSIILFPCPSAVPLPYRTSHRDSL